LRIRRDNTDFVVAMVNYKRQHFVPKFYLKCFSSNGLIQIYNTKSKQFHELPYGSVCSKDYFYSKIPEGERSFSQMESEWNRILSIIIRNADLNDLTCQDYTLLLFFITFQNARTKKGKMEVERHFNELINYIYKPFLDKSLKEAGVDPKSIDKWKIALVGPHHAFYMQCALQCAPFLISDLRPIIFINRTNINFIVSDSPIILYNSFFNYPEGPGTSGLQSPGLQIFCPLSPKLMLVLYDDKFYNFKSSFNQKLYMDLEKDIDALNSLQFFSCSDNIFFTDKDDNENVKKLHESIEHFIEEDYFGLEKLRISGKSSENLRETIMTYMRDIDYRLVLSSMIFTPNAGAVDIARDFNLVRYAKENFNFEDDNQIDRLFYLGEIAVSPKADKEEVNENLINILSRHVSGDWGEVDDKVKERNNKAIEDGSIILSSYTLSSGRKIFVRTEAADSLGNRSLTNVLTAEEL